VQAQAQGRRFVRAPLFEGGLVPSEDGFYWSLPQ
jgi:hypothetical protein